MKRRIAILHWLPAEMYPPLLNMTRYFAGTGKWELTLFTTANHLGRPAFEQPDVRIHRGSAPGVLGRWRRLWAYAVWQLTTLARLLILRPDVVVYIEPQSSFPIYLLSFFRRRLPLFIHHHEYHEPKQFLRPGMTMARWFHRLEKSRLFPRAHWISQTNEDRLRLFLGDHPGVRPETGRVLPNYPPASWLAGPNRAWERGGLPLRMVYVGSVSLRDTFIAEMVEWVTRQPPGSVELHIYAYNLDAETREFLIRNSSVAVRFHAEGIEYDDLPHVLRDYHVGLILYRARTLNYRFNASNKLFEYLACGLDVIFPSTMEGVKPYARSDGAPRVMEVDFETGEGLQMPIPAKRGKSGIVYNVPTADEVLIKMEQEMSALVPGGP